MLSTDVRFNRSDLARDQGWNRALIVPMLTSEDGGAVGRSVSVSHRPRSGALCRVRVGRKGSYLPGPLRCSGRAQCRAPGSSTCGSGTTRCGRGICRRGRFGRQSVAPSEQQGRHNPRARAGYPGRMPVCLLADVYLATNLAESAQRVRSDGGRARKPVSPASHSLGTGGCGDLCDHSD